MKNKIFKDGYENGESFDDVCEIGTSGLPILKNMPGNPVQRQKTLGEIPRFFARGKSKRDKRNEKCFSLLVTSVIGYTFVIKSIVYEL